MLSNLNTSIFGLGGVFVEVLSDVTFRLAPFDITEAHRMISEIKGIKMLYGARGAQPSDINSIAEALVNLSVFAHENAEKISKEVIPGSRSVIFGHIGDGNIHFNISQPIKSDKDKWLILLANQIFPPTGKRPSSSLVLLIRG